LDSHSSEKERLERRALQKKRRRRRRTVSISLIVILLGIALTAIVLVFFKVNDIKVENSITSMYTGNQIETASGIIKGQNIFSIKKKDITANILRALPYIGEVTIRRRLPNTVVLVVSETTDYVSIPYRGGYLIVSLDMRILSDTYIVSQGIPTVYGITPENFIPGQKLQARDPSTQEALSSLLNLVEEYGWIGRVTAINVRDKLEVYMVYEDRILIRFGSIAKLDYKFELLKETLETKLDKNFSGNINLATPKYVYVSEGEMRFPNSFFDIGSLE